MVALESRYHLLGGSHTMSRYCWFHLLLWLSCLNVYIYIYFSHPNPLMSSSCSGFTHVACDYSSIVASAEGKDGKDVLKAYYFTS